MKNTNESESKRFHAVWDYTYEHDEKVVGLEFFSEDLGYDDDDRMAIDDIEVGEVWAEPAPIVGHFVFRVK